jgi:glycosyltransferase involved in cell wall biosynthesis
MKKLAVLLPTYNAAPYIEESINSILNQTFTDFDLFIYDDCSTDNTAEIVLSYKDARIFYKKNSENLGIAKTLNLGLDNLLSHYEYIARMDADDWSFPERFQRQIDYFDKNSEIIMIGTQGYWLKDINQNPHEGWEYPVSDDYIKIYLLFAATFGHSSIIFNSNFFQKNKLRYDETIVTCEDWDLWIRVLRLGKAHNLPDFMMKYRILPFSNHHSPINKEKHLQERSKIISNYWNHFEIELSAEHVFDFYYNETSLSKEQFYSNCKLMIQAFNTLYDNHHQNLNPKEIKNFTYMLARKILNYWKRAQVSRIDPVLWWMIIKEVRFMNRMKLIKSIIR